MFTGVVSYYRTQQHGHPRVVLAVVGSQGRAGQGRGQGTYTPESVRFISSF